MACHYFIDNLSLVFYCQADEIAKLISVKANHRILAAKHSRETAGRHLGWHHDTVAELKVFIIQFLHQNLQGVKWTCGPGTYHI